MVILERLLKGKKYIIMGMGLILLGIGILHWNKAISSIDVFKNKDKDLVLESRIKEIFRIRDRAILEEDMEGIKKIYDPEGKKGLLAYEYERDKIEYLNEWIKKQGGSFTKIHSEVFLRTTKEKEDGYSINLAISTEYRYRYDDSPDRENSFRICTYPALDLTKKGDSWVISTEWYSDPFINSLSRDELENGEIRELILAGVERDLSDLNDRRLGAVNYALEYSGVARPPDYNFQYNSDYKNYNFQGGNCTNFASQTLYEGGGFSKTSAWNYSSGGGSRAWVNASEFNNYMLYSGRGSLISKGTYEEVLKDSYKLLPGDYIAFEKKGKVAHTGIVTGVDSKGYSLVNTHNPDFHLVPWDLGWNGHGIKFWLVRVNY